MIRALALLTMLLPTDSAAIQGSRLTPNAQAALNSTLSVRTATVATIQYAAYSPATYTLASFTFPSYAVNAGSQVRFRVFGTATNTSGGSLPFVPAARVEQQTSNTALIASWNVDTYPDTTAWDMEAIVTFSAPLTSTPSSATKQPPKVSSTYRGNTLAVGGVLRLLQSDAGLTGGNVAGGTIVSAVGPPTQSFLIATVDPNNVLYVDRSQPIAVKIVVGSDVDFTVQGGWIEAM